MKNSLFFLLITLIISVCSCKKDKKNPEPVKDEFSFVYNGNTYYATVTNNIGNGGAYKGDKGPAIVIDMRSVFNGTIRFEKEGCAYLAPANTVIYINEPGCLFMTKNDFGDLVPIDSAQVYVYKSGSLNISFSDCTGHSGTDWATGLPYSYQVCRASGIFDLTLINKNNQTIEITNGKVNQHIQL